jgi:hypothetical protein
LQPLQFRDVIIIISFRHKTKENKKAKKSAAFLLKIFYDEHEKSKV